MDTFSALADPTRRSILELLSQQGKLSASDIYNEFNTSHSAISQHLKVLRDTDLVTVEKKAQQRLYQINIEKLSELDVWIRKMTNVWNDRFDRLEQVLFSISVKTDEVGVWSEVESLKSEVILSH